MEKSFILVLLFTYIVNAKECILLKQMGYDGSPTKMTLIISKDNIAHTISKSYSVEYQPSKVKNVYINNSALLAFDILQIDDRIVYMNHYSANGRAQEVWECK